MIFQRPSSVNPRDPCGKAFDLQPPTILYNFPRIEPPVSAI
jgi:hypothetical protein